MLLRMEQLSRIADGAYKTEKLRKCILLPDTTRVVLFASSQKDRTGKRSENSRITGVEYMPLKSGCVDQDFSALKRSSMWQP